MMKLLAASESGGSWLHGVPVVGNGATWIGRTALKVCRLALICKSPVLTAVTIPDGLTVANGGAEDDHVDSEVTFLLELSEYCAVATNCADEPTVSVVGPETTKDASVAVGAIGL